MHLILSNMSYQNLLQDLNSNVIIGPYKAIGLRKPGEERGVWLFGENHDDGKREKSLTRRWISCRTSITFKTKSVGKIKVFENE